jgi:alpha-ribazole phosphatase/probable phosphoglycerate mutase
MCVGGAASKLTRNSCWLNLCTGSEKILGDDLSRRKLSLRDAAETVLIFVRHGDTHGAIDESEAPMAGWADVPVSRAGKAQAERLAIRLSRRPHLDAIYSSPLIRARQTTEALERAGLGPIRWCNGLKEIHCGEADGLPVREVQRSYADLWQKNLRQEEQDFRWPGGESYREFRARCLMAVRHIMAEHPSGRIVLVTHAGVISQIIGFLHGLSPARWQAFRPGNASISEISWRKGSGSIIAFDCREHLEQSE